MGGSLERASFKGSYGAPARGFLGLGSWVLVPGAPRASSSFQGGPGP